MRGTASSARAVIPRVASACLSSGRRFGLSCAMSVAPSAILAISASVGAFTFSRIGDAQASSALTIAAPAVAYASSG